MPKYDYACIACDIEKEFELPFDHWSPMCPECGYVMAKVYSAAGIIFRGNGWYKTDNRK